ncbi:carboxypeptidase-like regulatory domain-containing protein, partial [Flavobacteriaceae bacterium KMM 6898]|nr:carboxypeptidase-like regulatory domain-containing protein [Flavobacteriaceae bacterium KMM 6898]
MKTKFLLAISFLFFSGLVMAQVTTSTIRGTVMDDQNLPLLGANIIAVHTPTGTKYGAITNEEGRFNLINLRVGGPYEVTISYIGFKTESSSDLYLTLGATLNLDLKLELDSQELEEVVLI